MPRLSAYPIGKLVALSTTHIALADFADADSIIIGLDNPAYVYDPEVRARFASGKITAVGGGGILNQEMVVALQPDLLMVSGMPGTYLQKYQSLISSGIPVLINTEWMEQTPLDKAEWVKLMAALTNREALVSTKYDTLTAEYQRITALTNELEQRPSILSGSPFQGIIALSCHLAYSRYAPHRPGYYKVRQAACSVIRWKRC